MFTRVKAIIGKFTNGASEPFTDQKGFGYRVGQFIKSGCGKTVSIVLIQNIDHIGNKPPIMQLKNAAFNSDKKCRAEVLLVIYSFSVLSAIFGAFKCLSISGLLCNT